MLMTLAFYLFSAILIGAAIAVIAARNPVHSVFFLILAFFNAAALFVLLGAEFLAMILVVVYVGAVAVLFLFVVMMLDIDFAELKRGTLQFLPIGLGVGGAADDLQRQVEVAGVGRLPGLVGQLAGAAAVLLLLLLRVHESFSMSAR